MAELSGERTYLAGDQRACQIKLVSKIPCNECGALILPTTAESTGGVCMACKQGIRKSMEASRAYYARLKEYDPYRELWKSLVSRSSKDWSLGDLTRDERLYFAVGVLKGEVYNGGFDQFFWNSSGNFYQMALEGLEEIGATSSLDLTREAARTVFGRLDPPVDQEKRWRVLKSKAYRVLEFLTGNRKRSSLEALDKQFWSDPDNLNERLITYANERGLVTPFLKEDNSK